MAAIGGFIGMGKNCGGYVLEMSKGMMLRSGGCRGAYINGAMGIFYGGDGWNMPHLEERDGKNICIVADGAPSFDGLPFNDPWSFFISLYNGDGQKLSGELCGEYAVALLDEGRGELLLLRDGRCSKPLFYMSVGEGTAFASEIKGLMRLCCEGMIVDAQTLRAHIFDLTDTGASDIYTRICEVPSGGGCLCTAFGAEPFYGHAEVETEDYYNRVMEESFICPDGRTLREMLRNILFAFDYPCFDPYMPSFIERLRELRTIKEKSFLALEDSSLCMSLNYSEIRRDRLSSLLGLSVKCVPPKRSRVSERELRRMEGILWGILFDTCGDTLTAVFGKDFEERLRREKNTVRRIRMLGMLCQTVDWLECYNIILK